MLLALLTISNYFQSMTQLSNKNLEKAMVWLARDCALAKPKLVASIFSAEELVQALDLDIDRGQVLELMHKLEQLHMVVCLNKVSPTGDYFNVHQRVLKVFHPTAANKRFAANNKTPEEGFCFVFAEKKTYRQACAGRKCRYYLPSEKQCVLGKFFV
jgi:hypothetical protein